MRASSPRRILSASTRTIRTARTTSWSRPRKLHLPIGKSIKTELRSLDVLHDFTVPQFRAKMNMVPGLVTYLWYTPTRVGDLRRFLRAAVRDRALRDARHGRSSRTRAAFQHVARGLPDVRADPGRNLRATQTAGAALYAVCAACHGAQAEGNPALNAPKLSRTAGLVPEAPAAAISRVAGAARTRRTRYGKMMAPMAATLPDDAAINNVVAYIKTLPDTPAPATVKGNAKNGQRALTSPAPPVTAPTARESRRRTRRGSRA